MPYSKHLEKTEGTLFWLVDQALSIGDGQFLDAINNKKLSLEEVQDFLADAIIWHSNLNKEVRRLNNFAKDFNKQFTTDHNKCFATAEMLFNRIRSGIGGAKRFYGRFCPRVRSDYKRMPWSDKDKHVPTVFERSYLSSSVYTGDLFGFDLYPVCVYHLYTELASAIKDLAIGLLLCRQVLREEEMIRNTPEILLKIYEQCLEEAMESQKIVIKYLENIGDEGPKNEISEKMHLVKHENDKSKLIRELFHNCDPKQFLDYAIVEKILMGRANNMVGVEPMLWPENKKKAEEVRIAIEHFDELSPKGLRNRDKTGKEYCISGKYMGMLTRWSNVKEGKDRLFVEEHFNKRYHGQYQTITYKASHTALCNMVKAGEKGDKEYASFVSQVESLVAKYSA